jgi:hypothetical protein
LFKQAAQSPFISLQNVVYFIMLPFLVPVLFAFYIFIKILMPSSGAKRLKYTEYVGIYGIAERIDMRNYAGVGHVYIC